MGKLAGAGSRRGAGAVLGIVAVLGFAVGALAASGAPLIVEFPSVGHGVPVAGPGGNGWFGTVVAASGSSGQQSAIGRVAPDGTITYFTAGLEQYREPQNLAAGSDGNVWFVGVADATLALAIGRVTPTGSISFFTTGLQADSFFAQHRVSGGLVPGADGSLWFSDIGKPGTGAVPSIGRIVPCTSLPCTPTIQEFPVPRPWVPQFPPVRGSDGNMWFSVYDGASGWGIARITPAGAISQFPITTTADEVGVPDPILGGDGNLWFAIAGGPFPQATPAAIARITSAGVITEFSAGLQPGNRSVPEGLTLGPDGNVWFIDAYPGYGDVPSIGRITPSGQISEFHAGLQPCLHPRSPSRGPQ